MRISRHGYLRGLLPPAVAMAACLVAAVALAGIVIEEKPASLLTKSLKVRSGKVFIPAGDLARALGGTGRYDPASRRYEIRPGAQGALKVNPGPLGALAAAAPQARAAGRLSTPAGGAQGPPGVRRFQTEQAFVLSLGGSDVMIEEEEHVMLRPGELGLSIGLLGRLLGGSARFDPARGARVLPPGGPGSPLMFR